MTPEVDAYAFASIAGHEGVTEDSDDFADAEAGDVLARLRDVTSEMDEAWVSVGSLGAAEGMCGLTDVLRVQGARGRQRHGLRLWEGGLRDGGG